MTTTSTTAGVLPGFLLCFGIASAASFAGSRLPIVGGAVFGILLGIVLGGFLPLEPFRPGIRFSGKRVLQGAVILLGFGMRLSVLLRVGAQSLFVMVFTLGAAYLSAALLARLLKVPANEAILIGVGTSICGGSAIAAAAPVIGAREEEVAQSISTIFLFNVIALFLFPALGRFLRLSDGGFGLWAGTAINDTSSVVAAASAWSEAVGNTEALSRASIVKLTRTLMIVPVTVALAFRVARKGGASTPGPRYSLARVFPWFVPGFVAAATLNSFVSLPDGLTGYLAVAGKFLIVLAMGAIGLSTDLRRLLSNGRKPILLGLGCWAAVAAVSLAVQYLTGSL